MPSRIPSVLAISLLLLAGCSDSPESAAPKSVATSAIIVDVLKVQPQPFRETIFATGTLLANEVITLQTETAGIVTRISFEEGRPVKAGDVLVVMDDAELQARVSRAEAELGLATALERRQRELREASAVSSSDYDQSAARLAVARSDVELAQAQLSKRTIRAPFDGVIGLRRVSVGAYLTPGTVIGTLQDISSLKLDFSVPERYYGFLNPGRDLRFRLAGRNDVFSARIVAVEPSADLATRSVLVRSKLAAGNANLIPGAFVEVEVPLEEVRDAIIIPAIALVPGLSRQIVYVAKNGVAEEREVRPGMRTASGVQILDGLKADDELIVSGVLLVRNGLPVRTRTVTSVGGVGVKP